MGEQRAQARRRRRARKGKPYARSPAVAAVGKVDAGLLGCKRWIQSVYALCFGEVHRGAAAYASAMMVAGVRQFSGLA